MPRLLQLLPVALICLFGVGSAKDVAAQDYQLVWSDEFDGTELDTSKWEPQIGTGCPNLCGWGNNELQYYRAENATVESGFLTITAKLESIGNSDYTSARLRTLFQGDWKHGRFEIRAKLPIGQGIWPAFWMLPTDELYGGWAASGEIDIMEYVGQDPDRVFGTLHYGGSYPDNVYSGSGYDLPTGNFNEDFHDFVMEWDDCAIRWYVDGNLYATQSDWYSGNAAHAAPFDQRFHMLLNMAVGGNLPGPPDGTTVFPQELVIDYVRVYQETPSFDDCRIEFDGMEHGNPYGRGWFIYGGTSGQGSIGPNFTDIPPIEGCAKSLQTSWVSQNGAGWFGGFGRTNKLDLSGATHFSLWINPSAGQEYLLELNLQEDDDGDDAIPSSPDGGDDEFQYNFTVGAEGADAVAGGGWQRVAIPLSSFFDDNSYHWGGNGVLDPIPVSAGGNGRLINVVCSVVGANPSNLDFRTDRWVFTRQTASIGGKLWEDQNGNGVDDGEPGIAGATVELIDFALGLVVDEVVTSVDGSYQFDEILGAFYKVRVDASTLPAELEPSFDPDGLSTPHEFDRRIDCDEIVSGQDFGYSSAAADAPLPIVLSVPQLSPNTPNPWSESTEIEWRLPQADGVHLAVFDVQGRQVRNLYQGLSESGTHRVSWDGRDEQGVLVPAGTYFYRMETSQGEWVRAMSRIR